jgi:hypothetical protein
MTRLGSLFKPRQERIATRQAHEVAKADALLLQKNPELARLTSAQMEDLLAAQTEVPPETLRQLKQDRAKAVQTYFLSSGKVSAERLFLVAPKAAESSPNGHAQVTLALE